MKALYKALETDLEYLFPKLHNDKAVKALCTGILELDKYKISCAVLEDRTRVLVE